MKNIIFLTLILCALSLLSCNETTTVHIPDPTINIPVITNVEDAYTYTVNAETFSDSVSGILDFTTDESVITYTVLDYSEGSIRVKVDDTASCPIYQDLIENNVVLVDNLNQKPYLIELVLDNFTGTLEFVLARED